MLSRYALQKRCPFKLAVPPTSPGARNCEGPQCLAWDWTGGKADPLDGDCSMIRPQQKAPRVVKP